jgi:hypothetical protein
MENFLTGWATTSYWVGTLLHGVEYFHAAEPIWCCWIFLSSLIPLHIHVFYATCSAISLLRIFPSGFPMFRWSLGIICRTYKPIFFWRVLSSWIWCLVVRCLLYLPPGFTLVSCLAYVLTLKMETICSSGTSADFKLTTGGYIPADSTLPNHRCENLKSYYIFWFILLPYDADKHRLRITMSIKPRGNDCEEKSWTKTSSSKTTTILHTFEDAEDQYV